MISMIHSRLNRLLLLVSSMEVITISENGVDYENTETSETDNENTAQYTESVGQDIYLLQMSLDRLELGVDAGVKILIVIAFLLCVQAGAKIAEMFMHWFTR